MAFTSRGKAFAMSNWEGAAIQHGAAQGVRYRLVEWLNDGQRLVMISDATGEEALEIQPDMSQTANGGGSERFNELEIGRAIFLKVSPQEDALLLANHCYELFMLI